jgi:hypothetical protein
VKQTHQEGDSLFQQLSTSLFTADLSDTAYADDHAVVRPVFSWSHVQQELQVVRDMQDKHRLQVNVLKSSILVDWHGADSQANRQRFRHKLPLPNGESLPIEVAQKHLGTLRTATPNLMAAAHHRFGKAKVARRTLRKVLGNRHIPEQVRAKYFSVWLTPNLLHGFHMAVLTEAVLTKLESFHMNLLRGSTHHFAKIDGLSNNDLRTRFRIPTVASLLLRSRLKWWLKQAKNLGGPLILHF